MMPIVIPIGTEDFFGQELPLSHEGSRLLNFLGDQHLGFQRSYSTFKSRGGTLFGFRGSVPQYAQP